MKTILGFFGALVGGVLGFLAVGWLARQGLYSIILPGAFVGFFSLIGRFPHILFPILISIAALLLGYYTEWKHFPFAKDQSIGYFIENITTLKPLTHIMALVGAAIAFWAPYRKFKAGHGSN